MVKEKKVYKNPESGKPLISTISTGMETPILQVKFCSIVRPFYYPNSPKIARYSITCVIDPEIDSDFLSTIQTIESNEKVESVIKPEIKKERGENIETGKFTIKFQGKDLIPVYLKNEKEEEEEIKLEDELAKGEKVKITFDILRYTKRNTVEVEHGLNFKPICIHYFI